MSTEPRMHDPVYTGGPCRHCGLRYSPSTAYVACLISWLPGEEFRDWLARQPEEVRALYFIKKVGV